MNLQKFAEQQKELDNAIIQKNNLQNEYLINKKIIALHVEFSELLNELPETFKYWSNKKNNYKKALEEYVDCVHFAVSIGNDLGTFPKDSTPIMRTKIEEQITDVLRSLGYMIRFGDGNHFLHLFNLIEGLGLMLGFTQRDIDEAYSKKNKINHQRQTDGY